MRSINEHNKIREIEVGSVISYSEKVMDDNGEVTDYLTLVKGGDYSAYYINMRDDSESMSGTFTIETDSAFYEAFFNLLHGDSELNIVDDYSERKITLSWDEDANVILQVALLPGEIDGSIELKNIMFDLRSEADRNGSDLKARLSGFFDDISRLAELKEESEVKLTNKPQQ